MASSNNKIMIPVPSQGLREDIDRTVSNSGMLVSGQNVVSIDGTIRPRPCHKLSSINRDQGLSWGLAWDAVAEGYDAVSVSGVSDGTNELLMVFAKNYDTGDWGVFYSDDEGVTWAQATTGLDGAPWLDYIGDFIPVDVGTGWYLVVPLVVYPSGEPRLNYSDNFSAWLADPSNVTLNIQLVYATWGGISDAGSAPSVDYVKSDIDLTMTGAGGEVGYLYSLFRSRVDGSDILLKVEEAADPSDPKPVYEVIFDIPTEKFDRGAGWRYLHADNGHVFIEWSDTSGNPIIADYDAEEGANQSTFRSYDLQDHGMDIINDAGYAPGGTDVMFVGGEKVTKFNGTVFTTELLGSSAEFALYGHDGSDEFALGQSLYITDDGWSTVTQLQSSPTNDPRQITFVEYVSDPGNYNWFVLGPDPATGDVNVYDMPDVAGNYGECTNLFQVDLPTDAFAIFNGNTQQLLKFNRASDDWDNISFGSQSDAGNYPDSSITYPGELPNNSYNMGGSRENHPTIFRTFEAGGHTWILATNGVFPPVMYHEGIGNNGPDPGNIDEFTPIGRVTDEPVSGWFGEVGFVGAPTADCMAIVGRRMILGGVTNDSGDYGITFSHVNEHRLGWDASNDYAWTVYAMLGDTPGRIVTIREITALAAAVYKEDAIYHCVTQADFLGQNAPFRFELVKAGISGPSSQLSVVRIIDGRQAYLATDGGVYLYDGVQPLDAGRHIRTAIQKDIDEYTIGLSWGMMDPYNKLLWMFYPTQNGRTNRALVLQTDAEPPWPAWRVAFPSGWDMAAGGRLFNFADKTIGSFGDIEIGSVHDALGAFASGLYEITLARADNTFYVQKWTDDGDYSDSKIPIQVRWTQGWEAIEDPFRFATAQEAQHLISSPRQDFHMDFRLEAEQAEANDIMIEDWEPIGPSTHYNRTTHRITGKRFAASFRAAITHSFKWGGLGLYHYMRSVR
jgi:hypothetical protein